MSTQLPLFEPASDWTPPQLSELPSWGESKRICVDCETRDEKLKDLGPGVRRPNCYITGVSFAIEDGPAHYLPMRHAAGGNLDPKKVLEYLRDQAAVFKGELVGANLPYDIDYLAEEEVVFDPKAYLDVQVAEPLIDELQTSYSLEAIAGRYEMPGKDTHLLEQAGRAYGVNHKSGMWKFHSKFVGPYGTQDARLPLKILRKQERRIDDEDLWDIFDLECKVLPALVRMRRRGVRIDFDKLVQIEQWSLEEEAKALAEIKRQTGIGVAVGDVWKAGPLARVLEHIGVNVPDTPKTKKPSVTSDLLKSVDHEVARLIQRARHTNKLRTTFAASVRRHETNGRIHCTFNQLRRQKDEEGVDEQGARYGRLSCTNPNLQQQPGKKNPEFGLFWRQIYVPEVGARWGCADYSQQEPRWSVHYAEKQRLPRAAEAAQRYRDFPNTDSHQMMSEMTGLDREHAKIIFLGLSYGMGGGKLCRSLGLPTEWTFSKKWQKMIEVAGPEGRAILDRFHREVPFVSKLAELCKLTAEERGWLKTILGRHCHFPKTADGTYDWTHAAGNRLIQGSAADQTKKALVDADAAGHPVQIQVHDELDESIESQAQGFELADIMMAAVPCNVPHPVELETGPNWGQLKKVKR